MKTTIQIKGTHCVSCKNLLEDVIGDVKGVKKVDVDFKSGKTTIEHDGKMNLSDVKKEIKALKLYEVI